MQIEGYKKTSYKELQKVLNKRYEDAGIHEINIAAAVDVKSVSTVRNALHTDTQIVSDEVLTKVCSELDCECIVVWSNGERLYFTQSG